MAQINSSTRGFERDRSGRDSNHDRSKDHGHEDNGDRGDRGGRD